MVKNYAANQESRVSFRGRCITVRIRRRKKWPGSLGPGQGVVLGGKGGRPECAEGSQAAAYIRLYELPSLIESSPAILRESPLERLPRGRKMSEGFGESMSLH